MSVGFGSVRFMQPKQQLTFDCSDADRQVAFWALALGYVVEPPPGGFTDWFAYWRSQGVPEDELDGDGSGNDSIIDPNGVGPRVWFQIVPEGKTAKNRLHLDLSVSGGRSTPKALRQERIRAKADELIAAGAELVSELEVEGSDYYGMTLLDPEGNEFCIN